jgi:outer membrane biosynthesis protein TonB
MSSLKTFFDNNILQKNNITSEILLLSLLYFVLVPPKISANVANIFNNDLFKFVYIFFVVCLISKNPLLAFIVSFILVFLLNKIIDISCNMRNKQTANNDDKSNIENFKSDPPKSPSTPKSNKPEPKPSASTPLTSATAKSSSPKPSASTKPSPSTKPSTPKPSTPKPQTPKPSTPKPKPQTRQAQPQKKSRSLFENVEGFESNDSEYTNSENDNNNDNNNVRLTQRQQMKNLWTQNQKKDPAILSGHITDSQKTTFCNAADENSHCDVLGTNIEGSTSFARVAENDDECPETPTNVYGVYDNLNKQYGRVNK